MESLFVEKYKPLCSEKVIGQHGPKSNVKKLTHWLQYWKSNYGKKPGFGKWASDDGAGFKAALLSGPPGVGKTTSATLVCKELGFTYTELNASDTRSKKSLTEVVSNLLSNRTFSDIGSKVSSNLSSKHVLIMDEVDGMAGNEDRGGVAELIKLIQKTHMPIICICNDRSHPKMRSLVNYCFDLRFTRPRVEQIKAHMLSVCFKEGIKISADALNELIISSNQDIRQVLHFVSLLATAKKGEKVDFKQQKVIKDVKLGPFDALKKLFTTEAGKQMSFNDRSDLFFSDYSLMPLFVHENYPVVQPNGVSRNESRKKLELGAKAIQSIAFSNLFEKEIRSTNNWSLLPMQSAFSTVLPSYYMRGHLNGQIEFPKMLGKISAGNKKDRLIQELKMHMSLRVNSNKTTINLDYIPILREKIYKPLRLEQTNAIPKILDVMNHYCIRKGDLDCMLEFLWSNEKNPTSEISPATKAALTKQCNASSTLLPYQSALDLKGKKRKAAPTELEEGDEEESEEEEEPVDEKKLTSGITKDGIEIKTKESPKAKGGAKNGPAKKRKVEPSEKPTKGGKGKGKAAASKAETNGQSPTPKEKTNGKAPAGTTNGRGKAAPKEKKPEIKPTPVAKILINVPPHLITRSLLKEPKKRLKSAIGSNEHPNELNQLIVYF
ncbi:replication factor C subunit 1-like [Panonychus citri]|uniref:replication factor C subunit 1-like n=1 Tax=Panonychus citri TaxID=50023 RepID=UPI002306DD87|nr:replication factor C subunit 1-like [Panonychus citri]